MANIKVKDVSKKTIKVLNKSAIASERFKDNIVQVKTKTERAYNEEDNISEYGNNKISYISNRAVDESVYSFNKIGRKSVVTTKDNIRKSKGKIKSVSNKLKNTGKIGKGIKNSKQVAKSTKKVAKESVKASKRATQIAREAAKKTAQSIKVAVKATVSVVKAIIMGTKALIAALVAGGWVAVITIIIICLLGLLCSSIFGIFLSSEDTGGKTTMDKVVIELNNELANRIETTKNKYQYDEYIINANRAEWKDILTIYTARVSKGNMEREVMTLDDTKLEILEDVFWDMNTVSSNIRIEKDEEQEKRVLYINISSKSVNQMMKLYDFNAEQEKQVKELQKKEYQNLWSSAIYGTSLGSSDIVAVALSQIGNIGGQPYWSWYGYNSRVEWCACFVSWCANQCGYIEAGIIPKFAGTGVGEDWFKIRGLWKTRGYVPKKGDIIFFDWEVDGRVNHVGIVEKVQNNVVQTIEGNSDDMCIQRQYNLNSNVIYGYGVPAY